VYTLGVVRRHRTIRFRLAVREGTRYRRYYEHVMSKAPRSRPKPGWPRRVFYGICRRASAPPLAKTCRIAAAMGHALGASAGESCIGLASNTTDPGVAPSHSEQL